MGTGSNRHVVGLDAVISLFSSSRPIVVKHCSFSLGAMNEAEVLDAVEPTFVIVFLMLSILSVKKFIKSLIIMYCIVKYGDPYSKLVLCI